MSEKVIEKLTEAVSRRGFLGKLSGAAAALVLSLFGAAKPALAIAYVACCTLCLQPGTCSYSGCACQWSWVCEHTDGSFWRCFECYAAPSYCGPECRNIKCSRAVPTNIKQPEGGKEDPNPPPPPG
jgi:hypothetical protein